MKLSIIIPCYNEAETIATVFDAVARAPLPLGWEKEIIIVDDGSDEATKSALKELEAKEGSQALLILHQEKNEGKGAALQVGMRRASGEYLVIQDADMEYDPGDYQALLAPIIEKKAESVFGSRVLGKNNVPYSAFYFYGGLLTTWLFNLLFGTRFTDIATCYKLFDRKKIPALLASHHKDFVFDAVDLTLALAHSGRVLEVPISYHARTKHGGKKLNWKHGINIVLMICLARLGLRSPTQEKTALQVLRFLISGTIAAIVNFTTFYVLISFGNVWYVLASGLAFLVAFAASFVMLKYWTFHSMEVAKIRRQLPLHFTAAFVNLMFNVGIVYFLVAYGHVWPLFSQIAATAIIAFESFFIFRVIFR
jgi:glycosyltransferase involved in cell wall biosynthesis